jgi:hypothetical protein
MTRREYHRERYHCNFGELDTCLVLCWCFEPTAGVKARPSSHCTGKQVMKSRYGKLMLTCMMLFPLIIAPAVPLAAQFDRNAALPFVQKFHAAFNEGADCKSLYERRNNAKRNGADNEQQNQMDLKLRSVGCTSDTAKRRSEVPPNTGTYTINEYRIYREVVSAPVGMSEEQALATVGKKYKMSPTQVRKIASKVTRNLFDNEWMDVTELEIRHASNWKDEKR